MYVNELPAAVTGDSPVEQSRAPRAREFPPGYYPRKIGVASHYDDPLHAVTDIIAYFFREADDVLFLRSPMP